MKRLMMMKGRIIGHLDENDHGPVRVTAPPRRPGRTPTALGSPLASTGRSADSRRNSSSGGVMTNGSRPPGPRRPLTSSSPGSSRSALKRSSSISRCVPWRSPGLLRQQILCSLRLRSPDSCASRERQRSSPPVTTDSPRQTLISTVFTKRICASRPQPCRIASTRSRPAMSCPFSGKPVLQASRSISSHRASSSAGSSPRLTRLRKTIRSSSPGTSPSSCLSTMS